MERHQKKVFLDLIHSFGCNFSLDMKNSLSLIEQDGKTKIIYMVGKTIVKKTIINGSQMQFIKLTQNVQSIQCMSISPTRTHIAICQKLKNQNFLLLNLYGLRARDSQIKHFKLPQTQKQSTFKAIAFSPSQPKYACCLTGQPDFQLIFLDVSRSRGLAVSNFSVESAQSISICTTQSHLISVSGKNLFKLYKVEDYSFKSYEDVKKLPKTRNFTVHSWFDKTKILIGTDRGQLFMAGPVGNNFQIKKHYTNIFGPQQVKISSICVFSKGFILGSSQGHFSLWMKQNESQENFEDQYPGDLMRKWQVPIARRTQVVSISICPKQQIVAVGFKNNTIAYTQFSLLLEQIDIQHDIFTYLYDGFHTSGISCMDVCMHRPIIATLSKQQNTVRLWNYKKPNCELIKRFDSKSDGIQELSPQLLTCLALHPLGYYMALGCCDKLRLYHILSDQLRNYREIVLKGVCQLKFSNGGQLLAAAYPRQKYNIHQINIYNSYTLEQIGRLSDHSNIITDLCWKPNDRCLLSVGTDGTISQWKQGQNRQNKQWTCKKWSQTNSKYSAIIYEKAMKSILVSGAEGARSVVRQIRTQKDQTQKLNALSFRITKLKWLLSQWNIPAILAGTQDGQLKIFNSAFDSIVQQSLNVHLKEITRIQTSPCGRYVFTASQDGNLFIYQVSLANRQGYMNKRLHDSVNDYELNPLVSVLDDQLADIVLVQRNTVNEKIRYIKMLEKNLQQMKRKIILQDQQQKKQYQYHLTEISNQKQIKIDELNTELQRLKNIKKQLEIKGQSQYIDLQSKNCKNLEDIEAQYQKKLALKNKRYFELQTQFDILQKKNDREIRDKKNKIDETLQLLQHDFVDCFKKAQKIHQSKRNQVTEGQKLFSEKVNQIQEEHEDQLKVLSQNLAFLEGQKNQKAGEYINNIESYKRQCKLLHDDIIQLMSTNDQITSRVKNLRNQLTHTQKLMHEKHQDVQGKQQNIKVRQQKIGSCQQRITQLQKKKQVLSYRTWQMRQQIQPKQDQIQFLKQELFSLENQFQNLLNDQKARKQVQNKIKKDKDRLQHLLSQQKLQTKDKDNKIKKLCGQINDVIQNKPTDKRYYQQQMNNIFKKYGNLMNESLKMNESSKGLDQMGRHMDHLDQEIIQVNQRTDQKIIKRDEEIQKSMEENTSLIKKVSLLRIQKTKLIFQLTNAQKVVDSIKRQINQIRNTAITASQMPAIYKKPSFKNISNSAQHNPPTISRSHSQPLKKGKLVRGLNYDTENLSIFAKAKVKQLENRLQSQRTELKQKQMGLKILKGKIFDHLACEDCSDGILEKCLTEYQI